MRLPHHWLARAPFTVEPCPVWAESTSPCVSLLEFSAAWRLTEQGCDFGIDIYGNSGTPACPGTEQVAHFIADGANLCVLPPV